MGSNWRISWADRRNLADRRGAMYVTGADEEEIRTRVEVMKQFPTIEDVRADLVSDEEWRKILADQTAYVAPTHRIIE